MRVETERILKKKQKVGPKKKEDSKRAPLQQEQSEVEKSSKLQQKPKQRENMETDSTLNCSKS